MKKLIKRIAAVVSCFAIMLVAGISLTACGKKEDPAPAPAPAPAPTTPTDTSTHVSSVEQFTNAIKTDNVITLDANLTLTTETTFTIDKNITLDLNGHKITNTLQNGESSELFLIEGGKLTVNATNGGEMSVTGDKDAGYIFYVGSYKNGTGEVKKGELVINGGSYKTTDASVAQVNYGKITVNDGKFEARHYEPTDGNYGLLFNRLNENVNYTKGSSQVPFYTDTDRFPAALNFNYDTDVVIVINGGKFKEYDPANNDGAKEDKDNDELTGYLASNKKSTAGEGEDEGWFIVSDK